MTVKEVAERTVRALGSEIQPEVTGRYRAGDIRHCFADISMAREALGWEPQVTLERGLKDLAVWIEGQTAIDRDQSTMLARNTPLVFGFVLGLAFLLLLVTFRSIVIPIKAIILNLLSVAAAYGVLVTVFQDGHGSSLLGFTPTGGVDIKNAGEWIKAGAVFVGAGSALVTKDAMTKGDWASITSNAKAFVQAIHTARGK
jgi:hypothetical protein